MEKFNSMKPFIEIKLKRNEVLIKMYEKLNQIIKCDIIAKYRQFKKNEKNIESINEIHEIEKQQIKEYCLNREQIICDKTNMMNNNKAKLDGVYNKMEELQKELVELKKQIKFLTKQIPDEIAVNNYKISKN
jgi:hypothetical protein